MYLSYEFLVLICFSYSMCLLSLQSNSPYIVHIKPSTLYLLLLYHHSFLLLSQELLCSLSHLFVNYCDLFKAQIYLESSSYLDSYFLMECIHALSLTLKHLKISNSLLYYHSYYPLYFISFYIIISISYIQIYSFIFI